MKYIIMECHASYAVLLDEEGRFCRAANRRYQIGQTVEDPVLMKEPGAGSRIRLRAVMGIAAAAACFLLAFTGYYRDYMVRDASICLTINPSVRMELNRKGQVLRVAGVNEDGKKLLEGYCQGSKDRLAVTKELIGRAVDMGYLSAGGKIVLDIDAPDDAVFRKYGVELRAGLAEYLDEALEVEIEIIRYDPDSEEIPVTPKEEAVPPPVEIEIERKEPKEQPPETPEPAGDVPETPSLDPAPPETPAHTPEHEETSGSDHRERSAGGDAAAPKSSPGHSGNSGHEAGSDDGSGSDDGPGAEDHSSSGYGEGSAHDSSSSYGEGSAYDSGSDYGEGSVYDGGSGYGEGSAYGSGSGYGEGSDYDGDSGYDSPSDYE